MTYGQRWERAVNGRALIKSTLKGQWLLWLCQLEGQLILCDDSPSGHLRIVAPDEDEADGIAQWRRISGPQQGRPFLLVDIPPSPMHAEERA